MVSEGAFLIGERRVALSVLAFGMAAILTLAEENMKVNPEKSSPAEVEDG